MAVKTLELFTLVANYLDEVDKLDEVDIDEDVDTELDVDKLNENKTIKNRR